VFINEQLNTVRVGFLYIFTLDNFYSIFFGTARTGEIQDLRCYLSMIFFLTYSSPLKEQ